MPLPNIKFLSKVYDKADLGDTDRVGGGVLARQTAQRPCDVGLRAGRPWNSYFQAAKQSKLQTFVFEITVVPPRPNCILEASIQEQVIANIHFNFLYDGF